MHLAWVHRNQRLYGYVNGVEVSVAAPLAATPLLDKDLLPVDAATAQRLLALAAVEVVEAAGRPGPLQRGSTTPSTAPAP